jgi:transcriptional regulator with XRE-family HTH domain
MTIVDRFLLLMEQRNLKPAQITRELGLSSSSFTDWKRGKGSPSLDVVIKFADYFNVSLDYIVRGEDFKNPLADKSLEISNRREQQCLKKFRKLSPELQDKLLIYADGMIAAMPYDEEDEEKMFSV